MLWVVSMPCAVDKSGSGNERYMMLEYYVQAETQTEAEEKAETWLPRGYSLDDSAWAAPYDPVKDFRNDFPSLNITSKIFVKLSEMGCTIAKD